jgi:hypothetical protein
VRWTPPTGQRLGRLVLVLRHRERLRVEVIDEELLGCCSYVSHGVGIVVRGRYDVLSDSLINICPRQEDAATDLDVCRKEVHELSVAIVFHDAPTAHMEHGADFVLIREIHAKL